MGFQQPMGWFAGAPSQWDQASLAGSFNTTTLPQPATNEWYMDAGATAHMTPDYGILSLTHTLPTLTLPLTSSSVMAPLFPCLP